MNDFLVSVFNPDVKGKKDAKIDEKSILHEKNNILGTIFFVYQIHPLSRPLHQERSSSMRLRIKTLTWVKVFCTKKKDNYWKRNYASLDLHSFWDSEDMPHLASDDSDSEDFCEKSKRKDVEDFATAEEWTAYHDQKKDSNEKKGLM